MDQPIIKTATGNYVPISHHAETDVTRYMRYNPVSHRFSKSLYYTNGSDEIPIRMDTNKINLHKWLNQKVKSEENGWKWLITVLEKDGHPTYFFHSIELTFPTASKETLLAALKPISIKNEQVNGTSSTAEFFGIDPNWRERFVSPQN